MAKYEFTYTPAQHEIFFENEEAKFKVVPKGRRLGFTRGAANATIDWSIENEWPILWVDTVNGNIDKYFDRYFRPSLKQLKPTKWDWNQQKKVLKIYRSYIDFKSAEQPDSIEGFGYKKIILNEAGIILRDNYLYTNAIMPMMMDFPDSQLIAAGAPKGKIKKDGTKHKFYQLWENVQIEKAGYWGKTYSSYDNPFITPEDIREIEDEIFGQSEQEIYGQFTEASILNPFFFSYNAKKHESKEVVFDPHKRLVISIDFNLNPFAVIFAHIWRDNRGEHVHVFDEAAINNGSIPALADLILERYLKQLGGCLITGDLGGNKRDLSQRDNATWFQQLIRRLSISEGQLKLSYNPTHVESRIDCDYVLKYHPDFKINPEKCPLLCRDMKIVQCDRYGEIIKANRNDESQKSDHADCFTGDTLIDSATGLTAISEIGIGDSVLTLSGYKTVLDKWDSISEVFEYMFSDGTKIKCTKDHKFYTNSFGYLPIHSIFEKNLSVCSLSSFITESGTQNTQNRNIFTAICDSVRGNTRRAYTGKNGSIITEQYQMDSNYITRMVTPSITRSKTMSWLNDQITKATMLDSGCSKTLNFSSDSKRWELRPHPFGTDRKRVLNGTKNTQERLVSGNKHLGSKAATIAAGNTQKEVCEVDFAQIIASLHGDEPISQTSKKRTARSAERNLCDSYMRQLKNDHVVRRVALQDGITVESCKSLGLQRVYDITIEGEHHFFANGILVHNCQRYLIHNFEREWIDHHQRSQKRLGT